MPIHILSDRTHGPLGWGKSAFFFPPGFFFKPYWLEQGDWSAKLVGCWTVEPTCLTKLATVKLDDETPSFEVNFSKKKSLENPPTSHSQWDPFWGCLQTWCQFLGFKNLNWIGPKEKSWCPLIWGWCHIMIPALSWCFFWCLNAEMLVAYHISSQCLQHEGSSQTCAARALDGSSNTHRSTIWLRARSVSVAQRGARQKRVWKSFSFLFEEGFLNASATFRECSFKRTLKR